MRLGPGAALIAAGLAVWAAPARAGDVSRLQIELPPDVRWVEPGQRVDIVQIVGIDAAGNRVGFGGVVPVLEASEGTVASVQPPYRFAYTAPDSIDGPRVIALTARLPGSPDVRGKLSLEVLPPGPYVRLRIDSDSVSADWGGSMDFQVRGETRAGRLVTVADRTVKVAADGPGRVEFVRLGHYRLVTESTPPSNGRQDLVLRAHTAEEPAVHGELTVTLGPPVPRAKPAKGWDIPERSDVPSDPVPDRTGAESGEQSEQPPADDERRPQKRATSVSWIDGVLRLTAWRARDPDADDATGRRIRDLPAPDHVFTAPEPAQRLRFVVDDATVREVTATALHQARRDAGADEDGASAIAVKVKRNKAGLLTVVLDARPERDGRKLRVTLRLARADGAPSEAIVMLRRRALGE